ncbi:hypothetical protein [Shimazuella kribbensis]|nr:hypothetical protein [Shimazuella kribbensis]
MKTIEQWRQQAETGDTNAMCELGELLLYGMKIPKNRKKESIG